MVQKIKSSNLDADILTGNTELAEAANNTDTVLVHDTSAGSLKKIQVSNLTAQAGDGLAKSSTTLSVDIPNTTLLSAGAASNDEVLIYDTSAGALRSITQTNLLNFPTISSVSPTNLLSGDGTGNHTIVITGAGFTGATAKLINASGSSINFSSQTVDSATQITGVVAKSSLPGSGEPYDINVTAATGLASTLENQINIDQSPVFSTAAGSIATVSNGARSGFSTTVLAADPESGGDVVYTLESGSLPAGASLASQSSGCVISGNLTAVGSNTTSTFTIRAKDAASNVSDRIFTITVQSPQSQSFTSSGTFSVPSGTTTVDVLVVAGGGAGGGDAGGGGGAGGLVYRPGFTVTPGGTVTVTVGAGAGNTSGGAVGSTGQDSVFGTLTAKGGGGGGGGQGTSSGGGSSGGARSGQTSVSSATQPTQSGESGNYGFGTNGGTSNASPGGGGGGGAGGAGAQNGSTNTGGDGGVGKAYTIADGTTSVYYAGGGGGAFEGGGRPGAPRVGTGGQGGGGNGGARNTTPGIPDAQESPHATAGTANRGGGGGGNGEDNQGDMGGGKGIVIVRY